MTTAVLSLAVALAVKPLVLVLAVVLLAEVAKTAAPEERPYLAGAVALFLVGEVACGVDVYLGGGMTLPMEATHDVLMAVSLGLLFPGLAVHVRRTRRCWRASCPRYWGCDASPAACPASDLPETWVLATALAVAVAGLMPLAAPRDPVGVLLQAGWGERVLATYTYARTAPLVLLEQVAFPLLGLALVTAGVAWARVTGHLLRTPLVLLGLGFGFGLFDLFRLAQTQGLRNAVALGNFLEESLEALALLVFLLWWRTDAGEAQRGSPGVV